MTPRAQSRLAFYAVIVFVVATVARLVWTDRTIPLPVSTTLKDGTRVRVLGATPGGTPFSTEKPWHRIAKRLLPPRWQSWVPASITTSSSAGLNSLVIWFELLDRKGKASSLSSLPWMHHAAIDVDSFRYPLEGGSASQTTADGSRLCSITVRAFPRRQQEFYLEFLDNSPVPQRLGAMPLPNPFRGPFPAWIPQPLPIKRTNGPLTVTLEALAENLHGGRSWVQAKWRTEAGDPRWRDARPSHQIFKDATGNEGACLSFKEHAWKLEMPFHRQRPESFGPDEKFAVTNLTAPHPGSLQSLDFKAERLGVRFNVLCLAGSGTLHITNGTQRAMSEVPQSGWSRSSDGGTTIETWGSDKPFFLIEVNGAQPLDDIRFRLLAADGAEIPLEDRGANGNGTGGWLYQKKFLPPPNSGPVSLEIIISRGVPFEFTFDSSEILRAIPPLK